MDNNYEIVSPYKNMKQYTKIQIFPHQMNSDIDNNMQIVLQKKVFNKCNNDGFVDKIHEITSYEDGIMIPENLSGSINYNIEYNCRLCIPIENTVIIGQVKAVNFELIVIVNGPIIVFIPQKDIETNIWAISNEFNHIKKNTKLKIGDYVKILILKTKINKGDSQIKCMGRLLDYASNEEKNNFFGNNTENIDEDNKEEDTNFII